MDGLKKLTKQVNLRMKFLAKDENEQDAEIAQLEEALKQWKEKDPQDISKRQANIQDRLEVLKKIKSSSKKDKVLSKLSFNGNGFDVVKKPGGFAIVVGGKQVGGFYRTEDEAINQAKAWKSAGKI